VDDLTRADTRK